VLGVLIERYEDEPVPELIESIATLRLLLQVRIRVL
jgi:hypothetical protein